MDPIHPCYHCHRFPNSVQGKTRHLKYNRSDLLLREEAFKKDKINCSVAYLVDLKSPKIAINFGPVGSKDQQNDAPSICSVK